MKFVYHNICRNISKLTYNVTMCDIFFVYQFACLIDESVSLPCFDLVQERCRSLYII